MNDRLGFSSAAYAMPPVRTPKITVVDLGSPAPGRRLAARSVDLAVVLAGGTAVTGVIALATGAGPAALTVIAPVAVLVTGFLYEASCLAGWSLTPGKRALGLRVLTRSGQDLSRGRALGRALCFPLLSPLVPVVGLLDPLWLLWDRPLRRCLHDRAAGTVVVRSGGRGHVGTGRRLT
jgi:uncharacterized RDD family membrane protein YckC